MRTIGHLENEPAARVLSDYLYAAGIENRLEADAGGSWAVWIDDEDQITRAKGLLDEFLSNPTAPKFKAAGREARERREIEAERNEAARKRMHDSRTLFPQGVAGVGRLTLVLIVVSVGVALFSKLGTDKTILQPLFITQFQIDGGYIRWQPGLPEISHGQVWRLLTPMFIHFGPMHILFNMLWMADLGTMIERRQGARLLGLMIAVIAVLSNLAQYLYNHAPNFGGMSGVVYGLIGYIWMRGRFDPASGLFLHNSTVTMAVVWYFLCLVGFIPNVANTVHTVGFIVGLAWGFTSAQLATRGSR